MRKGEEALRAVSVAETKTIHHDEGVMTTRSTAGICFYLPRPVSANHEFGILAVLWDAWTTARKEIRGGEAKWTVDICGFEELTLPLVVILSAISAELGRTGRKLSVVSGPEIPPLAIGRTALGVPQEAVYENCVDARHLQCEPTEQ